MNQTARQFNLKCVTSKGQRVVVRIAPGFNVVDDDHWLAFVSKDGKKVDPYVKELRKKGSIQFGSDMDDLELEQAPDTQAKSKSEPIAKLKADLVASEEAKAVADAKTETALNEAKASKAIAEKAELELAQLKASIAESSKAKK